MSTVNKTRYALLGLLTLGPMCGYELKKFSERSLKYFWSESYGQIYPMLGRLKNEGLVTGRKDRQSGRPGRIVFSITEKGRAEFREWMQTPIEPARPRMELLLRLFFGPEIPAGLHEGNIREFQHQQTRLLGEYEDIVNIIKSRSTNHAHLPYQLMTVSLGRHVAQAMSDWCDESLTVLAAQEKS